MCNLTVNKKMKAEMSFDVACELVPEWGIGFAKNARFELHAVGCFISVRLYRPIVVA